MTRFVKTDTILDEILAHKVEEIAARRAQRPLAALTREAEIARRSHKPRDVVAALRGDTVRLIAEIKRASPSKGLLIADFDPVGLARTYEANGAAAISVLTDERYFQGGLDVLQQVRATVDVPLLCKEFIIDPYQVVEAALAGADMVLLIAAALDDAQLADLHAAIRAMGMRALVEVHNEAELERVLSLGVILIGINNRDLHTFSVDLDTTARLAASTPAGVTLIAESGLKTADDVRRMGQHGAHAVLIGEGLVTAEDIGAAVQALSSQPRG